MQPVETVQPTPAPVHELLAPAGSLEAFFAALEAGADAIYCGLKEFSARARAKNFSLEEMERLSACAHQQGRRIYVTLNTLIKEQELPRLVEILASLAACRVDGLIIQDLGLWRLARSHFPELALHASTQMAVHNAAGVIMLQEMGFSRAVLARELSLAEIAAIRRQTTLELEHFVHGALCYSISGHCLFSSFLAGQSGNRGRCAQPCRRRYRLGQRPGFFFSTSDLGAISLLPQLLEAGVMSLKIEGRMKNAEYVATVVRAYRSVLDAPPGQRRQRIRAAEELLLAESYGRRTTCGLLKGSVPAAIAAPSARGGIGRALGQVERLQGNAVVLRLQEVLHVGDRVRIQPQSDLAGTAFTVQELSLGQQGVRRAEPGSLVRLGTPFHGLFQVGDQVYKVGSGKVFTLSEEACRRRLAQVALPAEPVDLTISAARDGLRVAARLADLSWQQDFALEMVPALHSPLDAGTLRQTFERTGTPRLRLQGLTVADLPAVAVKPSLLKALRREVYAALETLLSDTLGRQREERLARVRDALLPARPAMARQPRRALRLGQARDLSRGGDREARLILPLTPDCVAEAVRLGPRLIAAWHDIVWELPAMLYDDRWREFQSVIQQLVRRGFQGFRLNNLGHFRLFRGLAGMVILAGPWLYCTNSQAALALAQLGATGVSLSLEDDAANLADLLCRETGLGAAATIYGPIPLLTSRIPLQGLRPGALLESDSGESIRLGVEEGLTVAWAAQEFSLLEEQAVLGAMGCSEVVIDLSQVGLSSRRGEEVLAAAAAGQRLDSTTAFNFRRGLA